MSSVYNTRSVKGIYRTQVTNGDSKKHRDGCGLRRDFPLPTNFIINLTHKCNLACDMCTQYGGHFKNNKLIDLPAQEWEKFIASVAWVTPRILLFGGEPLIYPEIREIFEIVRTYGCPTELVTNGHFLEKYLEDIIRCQIELIISLDGTAEVHNSIRNSKVNFDRIVRSLEQIRLFKAKGQVVNWSVNFVLLPENLDNVFEFLEFIAPYEPDTVTFQHLQFSSASLNELTNSVWRNYLDVDFQTQLLPKKQYCFDRPYLNQLRRVIGAVKRIYSSRPNILFFPDLSDSDIPFYYSEQHHFDIAPERVCTKPWHSPTLNPNGDVLLCLDHPIGNITQDNFWHIWGDQKAREFRQALTILEKYPVCTRCCHLYEDDRRIPLEAIITQPDLAASYAG